MYAQIRRRGNQVILWTPNECSEFDYLWEYYGDSVDGVMTDKPTELKKWREKQG